jgi:serine/threonine protein phosphatase PrpC
MIAVSWGSATETGPRRNNQDALLAEPPVFLVADGMGGHAAGELASAIVVETFETLVGTDHVAPAVVSELIERANEAILRSVDADPSRRGMGTTLVGLVMVSNGEADYWLLANLGDSRLYRFAHGELTQLTVDHSYVQELVDAGRIGADEARWHPQRNIVTRVLGSHQKPDADYWLFAPEPGDRYLLCSDGVCGELEDPDIAGFLADVADPGQAAAVLVRAALVAGGRDNATGIVIDVHGVLPEDSTQPAAPAHRAGPRSEVDRPGEWI